MSQHKNTSAFSQTKSGGLVKILGRVRMQIGYLVRIPKWLTICLVSLSSISIWLWTYVCLMSGKTNVVRDSYFWFVYAFFASPVLALPIMALIFKVKVRNPLLLGFACVITSAYWIVAPQESLPSYELAIIILPTVLWMIAAFMAFAAVVASYLMNRGLRGVKLGIALIAILAMTLSGLHALALLLSPASWWVFVGGVFGLSLLSLIAYGSSTDQNSQPTPISDVQKIE